MTNIDNNTTADPTRQISASLLSIESLHVQFAGSATPAANSVNLSIAPGETLAVVGESGCGKTVTAMSILRLLDERVCTITGAINWDDRNLLAINEKQMRRVRGGEIAMIFQEPMTSLNPVYSIGDQIIEAVRLHRRVSEREAIKFAERALEDVGIDQPARRMSQYPHEFSGGMRQRAMIAMAIVCQPKLLLADEPTTALDVTTQVKILELLRLLQRERGMAMLLITHDFSVVARNADRVCVMYAGRVVEEGPTRDVLTQPLHPYTKALLGARPSLRGEKKKLQTVAGVIESAPEFQRGVEGKSEFLPWWPGPGDDNCKNFLMREIVEGRRVLCVG